MVYDTPNENGKGSGVCSAKVTGIIIATGLSALPVEVFNQQKTTVLKRLLDKAVFVWRFLYGC